MTSLADALPAEVRRVSAIRDDWRSTYASNPTVFAGMGLGLMLMEATINEGINALASGDVVRMLQAYEALKGYEDD